MPTIDFTAAKSSAELWRMRAEEMRTIAEETRDSTARAMMPRIAADYDRLAKHADDRASQDSLTLRVMSDYDELIGRGNAANSNRP
ncbi:MAG: hypothetical protein JO136_06245 [Hyphomicrobiales bacterium]|nr:hypothetical protein [Hyphomicrobiales bacterium]MBV9906781.1 hypothetical protein [Hyphomicrobiales bacterium]